MTDGSVSESAIIPHEQGTQTNSLETVASPDILRQLALECKRHLNADAGVSLQRWKDGRDTSTPTELTQGLRVVMVDDPTSNMSVAIVIAKGDPALARLHPGSIPEGSQGDKQEDISITALYRGDKFGKFQIPGNRNASVRQFIFSNNPQDTQRYHSLMQHKTTIDSKGIAHWNYGHTDDVGTVGWGKLLPVTDDDYGKVLKALQSGKPNAEDTRKTAQIRINSLGYKKVESQSQQMKTPQLASGTSPSV